MPDERTISAVIPAYNSACYLPDAVASIRAQTRPVDEIIVVDDGSTDNTAAVVRGLSGNIRLIVQPNAGPSAARNQGVDAACGEWIAFLDADDQWTPAKLERQFAAIDACPQLVLVASDMAEVDHGGSVVIRSVLERHGMRQRFEELAGSPVPDALAALLEKNFIPTGTVLVRRRVLREVGGFNRSIRYGEDLEVWGKIAALHPIACLAEVHMLRRRHGKNATEATGPMLVDLVHVTRNLSEWGKEALLASGIEPARLNARAWADLGYWRFHTGAYREARTALRSSLKERPTLRAMTYLVLSHLPGSWIPRLRQMKQTLASGRIEKRD